MQGRRILRILDPKPGEGDEPCAIADPGFCEPIHDGRAALVALVDDVHDLDAIQSPGVAILFPVGRARQTKSGLAVMPKYMAVRFALAEDDIALTATKPVEPIKARLVAPSPPEFVPAGETDAEPDSAELAVGVEIGNAQGRRAHVGHVGDPQAL